MKQTASPWGVLLAIVLGLIVGTLSGKHTQVLGVNVYALLDLLGQLFIHALMLVVVPLVASSIVAGIGKLKTEELGRLGLKTISFYVLTSLIAIFIGLLCVNLIHPGGAILMHADADLSAPVLAQPMHQESEILSQFFLKLIPSNIVDALAKGDMLGIICFSMLFGAAMTKISEESSGKLLRLATAIFDAMLGMTRMIMRVLPLGVFCLVATAFCRTGLQSLHALFLFTCAVILGLLLFSLIALPILLKTLGGVSPMRHFRAMTPALITAFSTSSSSATLPITMDCVEKRAGVSNRTCSFVIPLGIALNMAGSALYECVAAIFVAQAYGLHLPILSQCTIVLLSLLSSIGVAGVPAASLVAVMIILKAMHLPIEGIALFVAVDRILDMFRTAVNVFSDSCCAVLVARLEGEKTLLQQEVTYEKR